MSIGLATKGIITNVGQIVYILTTNTVAIVPKTNVVTIVPK